MAAPAPRPLLVVSYSHLFRGVRLRVPAAELAAPLRPLVVELEFSDGVVVEAELVALGASDLALAVPAYATATGHALAATLWPIDNVTIGGHSTTIKLGGRLRE